MDKSMRRNRLIEDNAIYHVTARANRHEMILFCPAMRLLFIKILKRARQKYKFQILNFCIMGNHIHLILKPEKGESLSRIMQWILSVFARAWNKNHYVQGHVWGDRFYSKIINSFQAFIRTFDYITQNPVNARLVNNAWQWKESGLWHWISHRKELLGEPPPLIQILFHNYFN
ncbi:transposase [Treponema sp. OttesenSCG-928-L16]|nr:transposase [Treponema sp. OttesenSCG-928-L16]